jgi:hypothetical protein
MGVVRRVGSESMTNTGLLKTSGQIISIDHSKRTIAHRSYDEKKYEVTTLVSWPTGLDQKMLRFKEKDFIALIHVGEALEDAYYCKKPDGWPQQQQGQSGHQFTPKKPRVTIGFTISVAQFESVRVEVEGANQDECKKILGETIDSLGNQHPATKDLLQKFKARVL